MKALVLGGNGFIGSHIVDKLMSNGHSVRVFDRSPVHFRKPLFGVDYRLTTFDNIPSLAESLEGVDIVYHLISTTVPSTSNKDPVYDVESNLVGTIRLLNLMRESNVSHIVYLSSGGTVYGIPDFSPVPESHPLRPICSYGVVKVAIENYLRMYYHLYGIEYVALRASNPYGERQSHSGVQGVIGTFIGKVLNDEQIEVWGDGRVVRDFIHVLDLAKLCVLAGESKKIGILNAGSESGTSINDIVKLISSASGRNTVPVFHSVRSYDIPMVVLDCTKAKKQLDWEPSIDIRQGITSTWKWGLSNNGHQYES